MSGSAWALRVTSLEYEIAVHTDATQIDSLFQELNPPPIQHVIIEPHADVLTHMRGRGWFGKPGVRILEGKWQDFVGTDAFKAGEFDVVYTDTFSEDYEGMC